MPSNIERDLGQIFERLERTGEGMNELKAMVQNLLTAQHEQVEQSLIRDQKLDALQQDMNRVKPFVEKLSNGYIFLLGFLFAFTSLGTVVGVIFSSGFQRVFKNLSTFFTGS